MPVGVSTSQTHGHLLWRNVVHFQISIDSCHILGTETHGTNRLLKIVPSGLFLGPAGPSGGQIWVGLPKSLLILRLGMENEH